MLVSCDLLYIVFFFFKQKTAYEMRISDWSSDVCSSDLLARPLCLCQRNTRDPRSDGQTAFHASPAAWSGRVLRTGVESPSGLPRPVRDPALKSADRKSVV